jgi:hypothetical protein
MIRSPRSSRRPSSRSIRNFLAFMRLRTLIFSCGFFRSSRRLFSAACALLDKNTWGGVSRSDFWTLGGGQRRLPVPETNLRDTGVAYPFPIFASHTEVPSPAQKAQKPLSTSPLFATLTNSLSRKSFPCHSYANTRDGGLLRHQSLLQIQFCPPFVFMVLRIAFPATRLFSQSSALPRGVGVPPRFSLLCGSVPLPVPIRIGVALSDQSSSEGREVGEAFAFAAHIVAAQFA